MKRLKYLIILLISLTFSCGETKSVAIEIKDVCSQSEGTNVTIQGYLSLPQMLEVTKYIRGGQSAGINYKLFLMTKEDASGDAVAVILSGTSIPEPNKIRILPDKYTWNDLTVYSDDGKTGMAGELVRLTGVVKPNEKNNCQVNVSKIER